MSGHCKESPDTKVIIMTGRETPAIRAAALAGGAFAFLVKPFDDEAFLCRPSSTPLGLSHSVDRAALYGPKVPYTSHREMA
jgi:CheY-like chemotaxis protein